MKPLLIHKKATSELEDAASYYESKRAGLGMEYREEVERTLGLIIQFPKMGARFRTTNFRHMVLRAFLT